MATKKTTTTLRRCTGSTRFGIEPHEAPVSEFPKQPSRKDGLGTMCTPHWRAYVKGLREARVAAAGKAAAKPKAAPAAKATTKRERRRTPMAHLPAKPPARADETAKAEALLAEVDALPGPEHAKRVGDADVQAALELVGEANGHGRRGSGETPIGETIDGGTEEADAA